MSDAEWLRTVVTQIQRELVPLFWRHVDEAHDAVLAIAPGLPRPRQHVESVVMRSLLLDYAWSFSAEVHQRLHDRRQEAVCEFVSTAFLEPLRARSTGDPRDALMSWANGFFPALFEQHPPNLARQAARIIRRHYEQPWTPRRLAMRLTASAAALTREFQAEFGLSIYEYQRVIRMMNAVEQIRTEKVEAVALSVGYRSKKNLYRGLRRLTGLTPRAIRAMSTATARDLVEQIAGGQRKTV